MSAQELVDIVDRDNNVTDTVTRKEMRQKQLPHRASYIAVCNRGGKFLVEIRTLCKDYSPGTFDAVVGGVMQHGEEWRIIKIDLCKKRSAMNDYLKPKSITVGYNANPKDIEKIKQICNKYDILFYKLDKANDGTFKTVR